LRRDKLQTQEVRGGESTRAEMFRRGTVLQA
jgi:hypothetical protein